MKKFLFLLVFPLMFSVKGQILDVNKSLPTTSSTTGKNNSTLTYDRKSFEVTIPKRLRYDMLTLMKIQDTTLDAKGAFQYHQKADTIIKKFKLCRDSTFLKYELDNSEPFAKKNNISSSVINNTKNTKCKKVQLSSGEYNAAMMEYSDYVERFQVLSDFFVTANRLGGKPGWGAVLLPIRNSMQARYFFLDNNEEKNVMFLSRLGLQSDFNSLYSANSTLVEGVLPFWKAPMKFSVKSNIAQSTSETDSTSATKLISGGLFNVGILYPVFFKKWYVSNGKTAMLYLPIEARYNIDHLKDKTNAADAFHYFEGSTYLMGAIDVIQHDDDSTAATLFAAVKGSYYHGGSQFHTKLSANDFKTAHLTVGIEIKNKLTISANIPLWSDAEIIKQQQVATFGISLQPFKND